MSIWLIVVLVLVVLIVVFKLFNRMPGTLVMLDHDDPEVLNIEVQARETLPYFWAQQALQLPTDDMFSLKVKFEDENGVEHIWVGDPRLEGDVIKGTIDNTPGIVKYVKEGEHITTTLDKVGDWTFSRNHKLIGNYTLRHMLTKMSEKERAKYAEMLGPMTDV